ncbi:hypothetical protein LZ016_11045 [Sphingomonas sp. SM33]|uniref:Inovirus Gp2 family protein n=1 Tax=Sphingomonas telluris TaxID=2907998 RepID=A0ABS9VNS7_9SPHN|nr:hypothetical protein [Sphingomonas telluris]MCH8616633.1 hypothetical protein [Sphingomonas telluris]
MPRTAAFSPARSRVSKALRAHANGAPPARSNSFEKQSKNQADWSSRPLGTVVAIYSNSKGALHGSARPYRKGRRSTALRLRDCENLLLAAEHAIGIGKPLNRMLTVHFDAAGICDPVKATGQLLKLMGDWLRCYNTGITAVWVREAGSTKGEHVHILLSIPPPVLGSFTRMQRGWFKKIGAAWKRGVYKSRPIGGSHKLAFNQATTDLYKRALTGALHYLLKGADTHARAAHRISKRQDGGELWGKRCGTTENIGRAARLRFGGIK